ncbi:MAG: hypothetical protein FIA92_18335 [Chloroflexi bacterium]|nr:hypothetical protein [Chloroflexota bacterium]
MAPLGALALYRTWSTMLFVLQVLVLVARARREEAAPGDLRGVMAALRSPSSGLAPAPMAPRSPSGAAPLGRLLEGDVTTQDPRSSQPVPGIARVRVFVSREPEVVFDYFADLRNEPQYNRQVSGITKTSPGPIAQNTTFEGSHRGLGRVSWRLTEYERPKHVVIEGQVGQGAYRWTSDFEAAKGGTWMNGRMEWQPPPRWRPFRRLLGVVLGWNARRSFGRMAAVLQEGRSPTVP